MILCRMVREATQMQFESDPSETMKNLDVKKNSRRHRFISIAGSKRVLAWTSYIHTYVPVYGMYTYIPVRTYVLYSA